VYLQQHMHTHSMCLCIPVSLPAQLAGIATLYDRVWVCAAVLFIAVQQACAAPAATAAIADAIKADS
jgi:hypothetical protein